MTLLVLLGCVVARTAGAERFDPLKTDSRTPYVHRITLYAADGAAINPQDANAPPYSPQATCGKCHPIAAIRHGWHFNASDPEVPGGRPGEPWILVDENAGTVLPVSGRRWPGTVTPTAAGLTPWQFVKRFGAHMPGGGFGEPSDEEIAKSPQRARWEISGRLEIDCLVCHSADQQHDPAELDRQIEAENFRWAPTAALGLGVVRGQARKLPDDWDPQAPPNPDYPDLTGPKLIYDKRHFDLDDRVFFNITRRVPVERCYFCHSFREVGPGATDDMLVSRDVHLAAGLLCVDCHRNEVDHNMVRGYETEAAERKDAWVAAYSCAGCHLGSEATDPDEDNEDRAEPAGESEELSARESGRYGAPHPEHAGLPPVHFKKLTCTACHSGPWPELDAKRFQTAMNHGLGLPTRDRDDQQSPRIVGPIFARQPDGKIAPQRMVWTKSPDQPEVDAKSYLWALAHDVRPATQALGVHGCTDCHATDAPLDAGLLTTKGEDRNSVPLRSMLALRGDEAGERVAWALAFKFRPAFKCFACSCALLIGLILLRNGLDGLMSMLRRVL